jgi:hypothetical protein
LVSVESPPLWFEVERGGSVSSVTISGACSAAVVDVWGIVVELVDVELARGAVVVVERGRVVEVVDLVVVGAAVDVVVGSVVGVVDDVDSVVVDTPASARGLHITNHTAHATAITRSTRIRMSLRTELTRGSARSRQHHRGRFPAAASTKPYRREPSH